MCSEANFTEPDIRSGGAAEYCNSSNPPWEVVSNGGMLVHGPADNPSKDSKDPSTRFARSG